MSKTKNQRLIYSLITVLITVPCFVFYCLSIENGGILNIDLKFALIVIPIELVLAYLSAIFIGGPLSLKITHNVINPKEYKPLIIELVIICSTVFVMCPWMSFLATILYKGIFPALVFKETSFTIGNFLLYFIPNFLQTVVINFPFALLGQIFFIQPITKRIFNLCYKSKS